MGEEAPKRRAVRPLKRYASWVKNVVRQFGLYPVRACDFCEGLTTVREDLVERIPGVPVVSSEATLGSHIRLG